MLAFLGRRDAEIEKEKSDHDAGRPNQGFVDPLAEEFFRFGGVADGEFADFGGEKRYRTREGERRDAMGEPGVHRTLERRTDCRGSGKGRKERRRVEKVGKTGGSADEGIPRIVQKTSERKETREKKRNLRDGTRDQARESQGRFPLFPLPCRMGKGRHGRVFPFFGSGPQCERIDFPYRFRDFLHDDRKVVRYFRLTYPSDRDVWAETLGIEKFEAARERRFQGIHDVGTKFLKLFRYVGR